MVVKMFKLLAITAMLLLLSSLLSSVVQIAAAAGENDQGKENEVYIWKIATVWENLTINAYIRVEIGTVGLFGLTLERPYALISFELKPEIDNYLGKWIEVEYEGLSGKVSRKLSFDEANEAFYFPPTQIRLDSSAWRYPFNTYRVQFTLSGENVSFSGSGENILLETHVQLMRFKIKWENNIISGEMARNTFESIVQLIFGIITPFFTVFWCSMGLLKKSTKKRTLLKESLIRLSICFTVAIPFVYFILGVFDLELMPIPSPIFLILIVLGIGFRKDVLMKLSKIPEKIIKHHPRF